MTNGKMGKIAWLLAICVGAPVSAQVTCGTLGADGVVGTLSGAGNFAHVGDVDAFSAGVDTCNVGASTMVVIAGTPQHPILTQNLYRLRTVDGATRFEQVGMSWNFHWFFALSQALCCTGCQAQSNGNLGARCTTSDTAAAIAAQGPLGPRWQVNAATGAFAYPPANPPTGGTTIARRLQAHATDLDAALNPGAAYFLECIVVAPDDAAAGNDNNNASFRPCVFGASNGGFNMQMTGTTDRGHAAIEAWRAADPGVVFSVVDVPNDGRFIVGGRATELASGGWRYEYAVMNFSSDRSARLFSVPLPPGITVSEVGFHDVDYHSGDGINDQTTDGTDWTIDPGVSSISWFTSTFAQNPNANALRWGTVYNFRFDADRGPIDGNVTLALFKPGSQGGIVTGTIPVPGGSSTCAADWNDSGSVDSQDFFDFLAAFFAGKGDFNEDGLTTSQDFFDFLAAFFNGC